MKLNILSSFSDSIKAYLNHICTKTVLIGAGILYGAPVWAGKLREKSDPYLTELSDDMYFILKGKYALISAFIVFALGANKLGGQTTTMSVIFGVIGAIAYYAFGPDLIWAFFGSGEAPS